MKLDRWVLLGVLIGLPFGLWLDGRLTKRAKRETS